MKATAVSVYKLRSNSCMLRLLGSLEISWRRELPASRSSAWRRSCLQDEGLVAGQSVRHECTASFASGQVVLTANQLLSIAQFALLNADFAHVCSIGAESLQISLTDVTGSVSMCLTENAALACCRNQYMCISSSLSPKINLTPKAFLCDVT